METNKNELRPQIEEYQKSYIELIARKVVDEFDKRLSAKIADNEKRLRTVEKKVFNGMTFKLNLLLAFYGATIAGIITFLAKYLLKN